MEPLQGAAKEHLLGSQKVAARSNLMTPQEAAAMLGVTEGTLQVWASTRRYPLAFVKIGRKRMYREEDLHAFIDSRTIRPVEV